jgi:hypothetical protein
MALMFVWLMLVTAIAIAALVTSLLVLSRLPRRPPPPKYSSQYGSLPTGYGAPQRGYPSGPPAYPPGPIADPQAATWVPRSRCAELNITD